MLVLSALLAACAAPAPKLPPAGAAELIDNFLLALDQDRLFADSFYGEAGLEAFTGGSAVRSAVVSESPVRIVQAEVTFPHPAVDAASARSVTLRRKIADGRIVEVSGSLEFGGAGGSLREVLGRLGWSCHEDADAEWSSFKAAAGAPFGPPPKSVSIAVCDLAPSKDGRKKHFSLDFGTKDQLDRVSFEAE